MIYYLAGHISLCAVDDAVILLDVRGDRYLQLRGELGSALQRLDQSGAAGAELQGDVADRLIRMNVISTSVPPRRRDEDSAPVRTDSTTTYAGSHQGRAAQTAFCLVLLTFARLAVRLLPFWLLLQGLEYKRRRLRASKSTAPSDMLAAFATAQRLAPWRPLCLPDAIALALLLWRRGVSVNLVIGVKRGPFEAHSWVQLGDIVLIDSFDRVRCFTPLRYI